MISVPGAEKLSLVEIEAFLTASDSVRFVGSSRVELYQWVERLLCHHEYPLPDPDDRKGAVPTTQHRGLMT
jgi:hypothetical protein